MNNSEEYFNWLTLDSELEDFEKEINPLMERDNNEWILSKIEKVLLDNREVLKDVLEGDLENPDYILINEKIALLKSKIEYYNKKTQEDLSLEMMPKETNILFARNTLGNVLIERQLEDIRKLKDEKYETAISLLERLYNGDTNFNAEKQKGLTNNEQVKGIYELKGYQTRLFYMREAGYIVVIGITIKKDDNGLKFRDFVVNMKKKSEEYRLKIRNGSLNIQEELQNGSNYFSNLLATVERGR